MAAAPPPIQIQKKRGMGCFGCGCAVLIVIAILAIVLAAAGWRTITNKLQTYTSTQPEPVTTTDGGDAVYATAHQKVETFSDAFERAQPATLHLTSDEINTLIARDPDYAQLRDHAHIMLQGDQAVIDSSFLLGDLEEKALGKKAAFADRYVNSHTTGNVSFDPGTHALNLSITALQLNQQDLPPASFAGINTELNLFLNSQLQGNQVARDFLARVQKIDIENGVLVIETK